MPNFKPGDQITGTDRSYPRSIYLFKEIRGVHIVMRFVSLASPVGWGYHPNGAPEDSIGRIGEYRLATSQEIEDSKNGVWNG